MHQILDAAVGAGLLMLHQARTGSEPTMSLAVSLASVDLD